MITVKEAEKIINENIIKIEKKKVDIIYSINNILKEDIVSNRQSPPFDRVTMDGIAINFLSWEKGNKCFKVEAIQRAGQEEFTLQNIDSCIEVMTGTGLPIGTDCVIRIEDLEIRDNKAFLKDSIELTKMQNIHKKGSDYSKNTILINKNTKILSTHIGVMASVGKSEVLVANQPSIAIISTGDELIDLNQQVKSYQIYMSNSYTIHSTLISKGFKNTKIFHIIDEQDILLEKIKTILNDFDIVILSGGVSMGKFDYIPKILHQLQVKELFHKVKQKPGKPFWFGVSNEKKIVFALPGNPVSTMMCFYRYVIPYLNLSMGYIQEPTFLSLAEEHQFNTSLTCFLPVKIKNIDGNLLAHPIKINTSGDYASLIRSDGFVELPAQDNNFLIGYVANFYSWNL